MIGNAAKSLYLCEERVVVIVVPVIVATAIALFLLEGSLVLPALDQQGHVLHTRPLRDGDAPHLVGERPDRDEHAAVNPGSTGSPLLLPLPLDEGVGERGGAVKSEERGGPPRG